MMLSFDKNVSLYNNEVNLAESDHNHQERFSEERRPGCIKTLQLI